MVEFVISRSEFVLTMYVGGGLIPKYMVARGLGLVNNFAVYILPGLISTLNVIVILFKVFRIRKDVRSV